MPRSAIWIQHSIKIPAPGKENDDHNPQRIAPRNLFDVSVGDDNLFHGDRYKWSLRFTVINLTNKEALYNFFSTFSGTHYVTPRSRNRGVGLPLLASLPEISASRAIKFVPRGFFSCPIAAQIGSGSFFFSHC